MASDSSHSYSDMMDFVMAENVVLRAFMLSVSVELAQTKSDPLLHG